MIARERSVSPTEPPIRNISDTALLAAVYRARENERPNALFRDPFARRLAGARGERMADSMPFSNRHTWSWLARTYLFDRFIADHVQQGVDMVINLAAGLDARPYRMALPSTLPWIEVDLPDLLAYKEEILGNEKPACALERIRLDLADGSARRRLFEQLGRRARRALVITEGLIIYLTPEEVGSLAQDLARPPGFERWVLDLASPALVRMLQKKMGGPLTQAGAPLKFGPAEGPAFFVPYGWKPVEARSLLHTAARVKRLPFWMRLFAFFPDAFPDQGKRPWGGVCLFARR